MDNKVSAIVVTFNRLKLLKENLKALEEQGPYLNHIIVINNMSTDGTMEYLKKFINDEKYIVVNMNDNLGGAGGFNAGLKKGMAETQDEYFWLMDDDTIPLKDSLKELMNGANLLKNKFGYLCSNVKWIDGSASNIPATDSRWSELLDYGLVATKEATFVSFLVNREAVKKVGYPITEIFIWGDDTEYSLRLKNYMSGYMVINSNILHKSQQITFAQSIVTDNSNKLPRYFYKVRNLIYIRHRYYNERFFKMTFRNVKTLFRIIFKSDNLRLKRISILLKGYFAGIVFNPKIEK